jgi:hypothetical protein
MSPSLRLVNRSIQQFGSSMICRDVSFEAHMCNLLARRRSMLNNRSRWAARGGLVVEGARLPALSEFIKPCFLCCRGATLL